MTIINVDVGDSEVLPPCVAEVMTKCMPCLSRFLRLKPFLSLFGHFPLLSAAAGLLTGTLLCFGSCATPCAHTHSFTVSFTHTYTFCVCRNLHGAKLLPRSLFFLHLLFHLKLSFQSVTAPQGRSHCYLLCHKSTNQDMEWITCQSFM